MATKAKMVGCPECGGEGEIECFGCDGRGFEEGSSCTLCYGIGTEVCAFCEGDRVVTLECAKQYHDAVEAGLTKGGK